MQCTLYYQHYMWLAGLQLSSLRQTPWAHLALALQATQLTAMYQAYKHPHIRERQLID
jgi:hypothetical protein